MGPDNPPTGKDRPNEERKKLLAELRKERETMERSVFAESLKLLPVPEKIPSLPSNDELKNSVSPELRALIEKNYPNILKLHEKLRERRGQLEEYSKEIEEDKQEPSAESLRSLKQHIYASGIFTLQRVRYTPIPLPPQEFALALGDAAKILEKERGNLDKEIPAISKDIGARQKANTMPIPLDDKLHDILTESMPAYLLRLDRYRDICDKAKTNALPSVPNLGPNPTPAAIAARDDLLNLRLQCSQLYAEGKKELLENKPLPATTETKIADVRKRYLELQEIINKRPEQLAKPEEAKKALLQKAGLRNVTEKQLDIILTVLERTPRRLTDAELRQFKGEKAEEKKKIILGLRDAVEQKLIEMRLQLEVILFRLRTGQEVKDSDCVIFFDKLTKTFGDLELVENARVKSEAPNAFTGEAILALTLNEVVEELGEAFHEKRAHTRYLELNSRFGLLPSEVQQRIVSRAGTVFATGSAPATAADRIFAGSGGKYLPSFENMENLSRADRARLLKGIEGAFKELVLKRGMPEEEFRRIIRSIRFEQSVLKGVLDHFANPVTFTIYAIYINQSENKLQAATHLASFLAVSKITGMVVAAGLDPKKYKVLPVALQFAIAIGVCLGLHKLGVFQSISKWVDDTIAEGPVKDGLNGVLSIVSVEPLYQKMTSLPKKKGLHYIDPENDWFAVLSTESTLLDGNGLFRGHYMTTKDFNDLVDKAIEGNAKGNPDRKKRYELAKITPAWRARQCLQFREEVVELMTIERAKLEKAFKGKVDQKVLSAGVNRMLDIATSSTEDLRNDKRLGRDRTAALKNWFVEENDVRKLVHAIDNVKDKKAEKVWTDFLDSTHAVARKVGLLRHLTLGGRPMYDRELWLGKDNDIDWSEAKLGDTALAQEGMEETLVFRSQLADSAVNMSVHEKSLDALRKLWGFGAGMELPNIQTKPKHPKDLIRL